jgi:hypothetical protein
MRGTDREAANGAEWVAKFEGERALLTLDPRALLSAASLLFIRSYAL